MKAFGAAFFALILAAAPMAASPADSDRTLQNVKGQVMYGQSSSPSNTLALHARTTLADNDFATTAANSQATLTFPDSSQVVIGASSSVQMSSFAQTDIAHASFVVAGKVRFRVNHPQGAQADYKFSTPTGQIAVRGTEGDIFSSPQGLQVNVYTLSNPDLPVQVTLANGQVFTLAAGQSLVATAAGGAITASVTSVTSSLESPFSEFGAANAGSVGAAAGTSAALTAAGAAAGAAAAAIIITNSNNKSTPAPAPSTTSVPITVSGTPRQPRPRSTP